MGSATIVYAKDILRLNRVDEAHRPDKFLAKACEQGVIKQFAVRTMYKSPFVELYFHYPIEKTLGAQIGEFVKLLSEALGDPAIYKPWEHAPSNFEALLPGIVEPFMRLGELEYEGLK